MWPLRRLLVASTALVGCQSTKQALGMTKVVPDEFRVVSMAPLVVPPDYSLRPPAPGEPRPQELQPESAARVALMGQRAAEDRSEGEKLLASKAGADKADPLDPLRRRRRVRCRSRTRTRASPTG